MERPAHLPTTPSRERRRRFERATLLLAFAALAFMLSLGVLLRAQAMPVEARTEEIWYAYQQQLTYDFTAQVNPAGVYPTAEMRPQELLRHRLPVDPPVYRRVLVTRLTESITMDFDYLFEGDRPANLTATYWVDGTLTVPNLWARPYPLSEEKQLVHHGERLHLDDFTAEIPIGEIVREMEGLTERLKLGHDQAEIKVRPVVKVFAEGLRDPVAVDVSPEYTVVIRGLNYGVEVDEPQVTGDQQSHGETRVVPLTVSLLGWTVTVAAFRQIALLALAGFTLLLTVTLVVRWLRSRTSGTDLSRLGSALIEARGFELPADSIIVEVHSIDQLVALHLQTDRPVIRVGSMYYMLDGHTCYRLSLLDATQPPTACHQASEETID